LHLPESGTPPKNEDGMRRRWGTSSVLTTVIVTAY
jgi:hypothetical protein